MKSARSAPILLAVALAAVPTAVAASPSQIQLCESAIMVASANFARCRLKAEAAHANTGNAERLNDALGRCSSRLARDFQRAQARYGLNCIATEPVGDFDAYLTQCSDDTVVAADGGALPDYVGDLATCNANLGTCNGSLSTCSGDLSTCTDGLSTCTADLAAAQACGNGVVNGGEQCDGSNLASQTCITRGFAGGTLRCASSACSFDTSGCYAVRFVDNGNGTVTDNQTKLVWEKKTNLDGNANYDDPHDVDNLYTWGSTTVPYPYPPNGTAFTEFLAKLNGSSDSVCLTGHCDWRLPTIEEMSGRSDFGYATGGIVDLTTGPPRINAIFGPTVSSGYWSSSTYVNTSAGAWDVAFYDGSVGAFIKTEGHHVRAVRGGS